MSESPRSRRRPDVAARAALAGALRAVQRGGRAGRGRRARRAAARRAGRRGRPAGVARRRAGRARAAARHVCVDLATVRDTTVVDVEEPVDLRRCRGRRSEAWRAAGREAAGRRRRRCGSRDARCTSTATGARSARSPPTCARSLACRSAGAEPRGCAATGTAVREDVLADGLARLFGPDDELPAARGGSRGAAAAGGRRRRAGYGQDDDRRADRRAAGRAGRARRARPLRRSRWRRRRARPRRGSRRPCTTRRGGSTSPTTCARRCSRSRRRRCTAARPPPRQPQPLPAPPRQPAPARRRRRRRDLDGVPVADGAAARGRAPDARLVLVGDPGQLASVEAGAVLGDIVGPATGDGIVVLDRVHRFGGGIAALAAAIRDGDADGVVAVLRAAPEGVRGSRSTPPAGDGLELIRRRAVAAGRGGLRRRARRRREAALAALGASGCSARTAAGRTASRWGRRSRAGSPPTSGSAPTRLVRRPAAARHPERLRAAALNGDTGVVVAGADGRLSRGLRAPRRGHARQPEPARGGRGRARDDDPQGPGLAVRHRRRPAA